MLLLCYISAVVCGVCGECVVSVWCACGVHVVCGV